ncbi:MAG: glycosyltransferase [Sporomusaceae bacterium]|jgi:glycosyltransferase involved in cell wall biosynthesis|nr:glycosyltransferase [Sporomusaceae bacterium]
MSEKKLTIVCPAYNQENFIEQALQSFVTQKTKYSFEAIVSDDCSTDNTAEIIRKYAQQYPEIIKPIFREKNLGIGKYGNGITTLSSVNTEYVLYCEGDDYFDDPLKIEKQINFLEENPDHTICFHLVNVTYENLAIPNHVHPDLNELPPEILSDVRKINKVFCLELLLYHNFMQTNSVMYRWLFRGEKKLTDFFPPNIIPGDWFLHLLHAREGKIGFINEIMAAYRRHPGGIFWNSSLNNKDMHYLNYGEKILNFYRQVGKTFLNSDNEQEYKKKKIYPLAVKILFIFLQHKRIDKIQQFIDLCPFEYEVAIKLLYNTAFAPIELKK